MRSVRESSYLLLLWLLSIFDLFIYLRARLSIDLPMLGYVKVYLLDSLPRMRNSLT